MNKPYGTQGEIVGFPFRDLQETFYNHDGIELEIKDGILYVGVDDKSKLEEAKGLAHLHVALWSVRCNVKLSVTLSHEWETNTAEGQDHFLDLHDTARAIDRTQVRVTTHVRHIAQDAVLVTEEMRDSASFTNDALMLHKALKYPALKSALLYYGEEVVDDARPLYGVYKALEVMIDYLAPRIQKGRKMRVDETRVS